MKNKKKKETKNLSIFVKRFLLKVLISCILFLLFLIGIKKLENFDKVIYEKIYNSNISFAYINSWYKKNFGNIFPVYDIASNDIEVFNEKLIYNDISNYKDGALLYVDDNYLVPVLNDGIIVFIGFKEDYGNTIIVEDENKLRVWYSNLLFGNLTIYDYVKKGDVLGYANDNKLYLVFEKDGKFEDYKKYI